MDTITVPLFETERKLELSRLFANIKLSPGPRETVRSPSTDTADGFDPCAVENSVYVQAHLASPRHVCTRVLRHRRSRLWFKRVPLSWPGCSEEALQADLAVSGPRRSGLSGVGFTARPTDWTQPTRYGRRLNQRLIFRELLGWRAITPARTLLLSKKNLSRSPRGRAH